MTYRDCLACEKDGTKPKRGKGIRLVFDPMMTMPGPPTIEGHRLGAELVADLVRDLGFKDTMAGWHLTREELLVACWWAGDYGPRRYRKAWGKWAQAARQHLWYGCINITDPPAVTAGKGTG